MTSPFWALSSSTSQFIKSIPQFVDIKTITPMPPHRPAQFSNLNPLILTRQLSSKHPLFFEFSSSLIHIHHPPHPPSFQPRNSAIIASHDIFELMAGGKYMYKLFSHSWGNPIARLQFYGAHAPAPLLLASSG